MNNNNYISNKENEYMHNINHYFINDCNYSVDSVFQKDYSNNVKTTIKNLIIAQSKTKTNN